MSILLDEANAYERGMDDDLTFQTVRELAGTAYMAGRSAPPTAVEIEAVAKRLCYLSQPPLWFPTEPPARTYGGTWERATRKTNGLTKHETCSKSHGMR